MINKMSSLSSVSEVPGHVPQRRNMSSLSSLPLSVFNKSSSSSLSSNSSTSKTGIFSPVSSESATSSSQEQKPLPYPLSPSSTKLSESSIIVSGSTGQTVKDTSAEAQLDSKVDSLQSLEKSQHSVPHSDSSRTGNVCELTSESSKLCDSADTRMSRTSCGTSQSVRQDIRQRILQSSGNRSIYGNRNDSGSKT